MLKCLIVDDDLHCRKILKAMLTETFPEHLEICGEAKSVTEALQETVNNKPDVIFLDVELPDGSGFDFLEKSTYRDFKIIFTTAHENYALRAFRVNATDYLLKPFSPVELKEAVKKITEQPSLKNMGVELRLLMDYLNGQRSKIALPTQAGYEFVSIADIIRLQAEGNYTRFIMKDGKTHLISKTLKVYDDLFENDGFCRIHASHLINMREVKQYTKGEGGYVTMSDGSSVEISRSKKDEFVSKIRM